MIRPVAPDRYRLWLSGRLRRRLRPKPVSGNTVTGETLNVVKYGQFSASARKGPGKSRPITLHARSMALGEAHLTKCDPLSGSEM